MVSLSMASAGIVDCEAALGDAGAYSVPSADISSRIPSRTIISVRLSLHNTQYEPAAGDRSFPSFVVPSKVSMNT